MITLLSMLIRITKGGMVVFEYMIKIKSIIDDFALINNCFSDEELITHTLNGLEDEFKELTTTIRVHDSTIIFEDFYKKYLIRR